MIFGLRGLRSPFLIAVPNFVSLKHGQAILIALVGSKTDSVQGEHR